MDGYDMSGYSRSIGPLTWNYPTADLTVLNDAIRGGLPDTPEISPGTLNGIFDNTETSGLHVVANAAGVTRDIMVAIGILAAPAQGDPVFVCQANQLGYMGGEDAGAMIATRPAATSTSSTSVS